MPQYRSSTVSLPVRRQVQHGFDHVPVLFPVHLEEVPFRRVHRQASTSSVRTFLPREKAFFFLANLSPRYLRTACCSFAKNSSSGSRVSSARTPAGDLSAGSRDVDLQKGRRRRRVPDRSERLLIRDG